MTHQHILLEREDSVGIITFSRPEVLNAMDRKLMQELAEAVKALDADDSIACIVITGAGERALPAGGDIHEQREDDRRYTPEHVDAMSNPRRSYDLVPRIELRAKTMWLAKMIAGNHRAAVTGVKALLMRQHGEGLEAQWTAEKDYTTQILRGAKAEDAFPDFIARKGRG